MSGQTQKTIKDSIIYSVFFLLISSTLITPLVVFTFWFLPLPFFILFVKQHAKVTGICGLFIGVLMMLLIHPTMILYVLFALLVASLMGWKYRNPSSSGIDVLLSGIIAVCVSSWLFLIIGEYFFQLMDGLRGLWDQAIDNQQNLGFLQSPDENIPPVEAILPFLLLIITTLVPFSTLLAGRFLLNKQGYAKKYLPLFRNWRLPRPFFYFYVLLAIYSLLSEGDSPILQGIAMMMQIMFMVQGLSFATFLLTLYDKSRLWVLPMILMLFVPILSSVLLLLGLLDTSGQIREWIKAKK